VSRIAWSTSAKIVISAFCLALPAKARRLVFVYILGYSINKTATVGRSIVAVDNLKMAEGSSIGSLSLIKGCSSVEIGQRATIGPLVWINGISLAKREIYPGLSRSPSLSMGYGSAITCMHLVDCSDSVQIGEMSIVAGWGSQILTHEIDIKKSRQGTEPVRIGAYCIVGTRSVVLAGAVVPDRVVVAAGSVVSKKPMVESALYGGTPARLIRGLDGDNQFFSRDTPYVR
jgi:acetyltransferase-like isoleucine patch superfamily enzyme